MLASSARIGMAAKDGAVARFAILIPSIRVLHVESPSSFDPTWPSAREDYGAEKVILYAA